MMLIITGYILYIAHELIRRHHQCDYDMIGSFAEFNSSNGKTSTFDTYRLIQCKRTMLSEIKYNFKWTGSKLPTVSSSCQEVGSPVCSPTADEWDYVVLRLKKPLVYNECTVVHMHTDNDDTDGRAKPYISLKVERPIAYIHFRVLLSYKPRDYQETAVLEKIRIGAAVDTDWQTIESVPFDQDHKMYTSMMVRPVPGYRYRLRWKK